MWKNALNIWTFKLTFHLTCIFALAIPWCSSKCSPEKLLENQSLYLWYGLCLPSPVSLSTEYQWREIAFLAIHRIYGWRKHYKMLWKYKDSISKCKNFKHILRCKLNSCHWWWPEWRWHKVSSSQHQPVWHVLCVIIFIIFRSKVIQQLISPPFNEFQC